jgi:glycine/D-amino acid oxidase-like deaminating enzyme
MSASLANFPPAAHSVWMETVLPSFPTLDRDLEVDVVIVGAGLTGITTAYLLQQEGASVALIERGVVAAGDTGQTTAHLTCVTDTRLSELVTRFGKATAKAVWQAGSVAIDRIANIASQTGVDCELSRLPGYLHAPQFQPASDDKYNELELLQIDAALAQEFGFNAQFIESTPTFDRPGIRFENHARFHPRKYLKPLLDAIPNDSSYVFEATTFDGIEDRPFAVRANGKRIRCEYLVMATHSPIISKGRKTSFDPAALSLYTSYVLGARLPPRALAEGLYWDTNNPYGYLRVDDEWDHQYAIIGGEDVKVGQRNDANSAYNALANRLLKLTDDASIQHRWQGQVVVSSDGLPFIGEHADREFIATGFCGNGFTFGTLSAFMARDRFLNRKNPWFELFGVQRAESIR